MKLAEYIRDLQKLLDKHGDLDLVKMTHPYPDDWDGPDQVEEVYESPRPAEIQPESMGFGYYVVNYDPKHFGKYPENKLVVFV